jgi:hypothetical protein
MSAYLKVNKPHSKGLYSASINFSYSEPPHEGICLAEEKVIRLKWAFGPFCLLITGFNSMKSFHIHPFDVAQVPR